MPGCFGGWGFRFDELDSGFDLFHIERLSTGELPLRPRGDDTVFRSFGNQPSLKMSNGAKHVEDKFAGSR